MYAMNGVDLSSLAYHELRFIVGSGLDGEELASLANSRICPKGDVYDQDEYKVCAYRELRRAGLVDGDDLGNAFYFKSLTPWGRGFIEDWDAVESEKRRATAEQRRHNPIVALIGSLVGGILGFFSGIGGSIAFDDYHRSGYSTDLSNSIPATNASPNEIMNETPSTNQSPGQNSNLGPLRLTAQSF